MSSRSKDLGSTRVLALCGNMVVVFGAERMTFEILRVLRESGAAVHCIVNEWENHRIQALSDSIGASSSTGLYGYALRRTRNPFRLLAIGFHVIRTSLGLLREHRRFHASHILVPEFTVALKNAPALLYLRARGIPVILRLPTAPDRGRFYDLLWRWAISPLASTIVAQSEFTLSRCEDVRLAGEKTIMIKNTIPRRWLEGVADREVIELAQSRRTLLYLGQIAPFKGVHLAVEATLALLDRGDDVQLIVGGAKPEWPPENVRYYEGLCEEVAVRGYGKRVHFVGSVSDVLGLMESSYILLAPILQEESFGLVLLEAKSTGLPVVGFRRGAIPELVEHERTGYLCRGLDRESLIEGIDYFLSDPELRDKASAASVRDYQDPANDTAPEAFAQAWRSVFSDQPAPSSTC